MGNPNLKPEFTDEWEIGADLRFLKNRIGIDVAYYNKKTTDVILEIPLAGSSGYRSQWQNAGTIQNKGIELSLSLIPLKIEDFSWEAQFNLDINRGKLVSLNDTSTKEIILTSAYDVYYVAKPGEPIGVIEGPVPLTDGKGHIVVSSNGMPLQAPNRGEYGTTQPKYNLGIINTFKYKNLSLSFNFDIRQGGLMYSGTSNLVYFVGNATQTLYNYRQPFVVPNSVTQPIDPNTNMPKVDANGKPVYIENTTPITMNNMQDYYYLTNNPVSERSNVIDRSYVKLRELSLYYTLPERWFSNLIVKSVSVGVVGRNLLLWTPKSNNFINPESTTFGNDLAGEFGEFFGGPSVRSVNISLKASF